MYGSLSAGSPHIMEPDCRADSRVWTDLLLWRSNPSEYLHGRYAWICGASSSPHPSRLLHLEYAPSRGLSDGGTTWIPMVPTSCWEGHTNESHCGEAGSGAVGSSIAGSSVTGSDAAGSSDGTPLVPATPIFQGSAGNPIPAAVQLLRKSMGLGVTFDSSANKPVAAGGQHVNACGRQRTRGQDDNTWPASHSRGTRERSSIRTTSKQMPHQVGEHPSGAPLNVPQPQHL